MHVGYCENCKYIDLMENVGAVCPRCRTDLSSVGIDSSEWNALNPFEKDALIKDRFPSFNELFGIEEKEPEDEPEEAVEEAVEETEAKEPEDEPVEEEPVTESMLSEEPAEEIPEEKAPEPVEERVEQTNPAPDYDDGFATEYVYVCYKCNSVAGHDGSQDKYFCADCGSDMVSTGYTVRGWADLSKDTKRKVTEDAKIMHMVSEIKRDDYGDSGAVHTPSIIKVVKNPDSDY